MALQKPIGVLVIDAGPMIKNDPQVSTLLSKAEKLVSTPAVISEIKDENARSRVQTTLMPFLELMQPNPAAIKFIQDFARKTGDLAVLSRPDLEILALAYQLECEKNGGDWRLRNVPGQKRTNGPNPTSADKESGESTERDTGHDRSPVPVENSSAPAKGAPVAPWATTSTNSVSIAQSQGGEPSGTENLQISTRPNPAEESPATTTPLSIATQTSVAVKPPSSSVNPPSSTDEGHSSQAGLVDDEEASSPSESDSEGWITPSNINRRRQQESSATNELAESKTMQVATLTTDFAMQNVLLQINLNLLSPSMQRVKHLKQYVLRCHACFQTTKDMDKQFCPRCGKPTLLRVACSTNANGEFKLHLKKHMQWNHRGDRYSIPKPVSGAANGRVSGGGKGGWGNELILAEDQREYSRAVEVEKREKKVADLMDIDYVPAMLSGSGKRDGRPGGRPKVGAGRNVNSKKK